MSAPSLLLLLFLGAQEEVIQRANPARSQYQEAVRLCREAEELVDTDPKTAALRLTEVLEKFGSLPKIECRLRIKLFADDPGAPLPYFPYQFRGRARLRLAQDPALNALDRTALLESAVRDFERSVERGAESSQPLLESARLEWWTGLRPLLGRDGWTAARLGASTKAREILAGFAESPNKTALKDALAWLDQQVAAAGRAVAGLNRSDAAARERAVLDLAWCDAMRGMVEKLPAGAALLQEIGRVRAAAAAIAGFRGFFRLKVCVSPWAEITRLSKDGKPLEVEPRHTPLFLPSPLELGLYEIELSHPRWGTRSKTIPAGDLQEGKTYILSGDMETGRLTLTESP